jgi:hypothetical protein
VNDAEFLDLHTSCVAAFRIYVAAAETTATMLAKCTANPLPLAKRLELMLQENDENSAHRAYVGTKRLLHDAALRGYGGYSNSN